MLPVAVTLSPIRTSSSSSARISRLSGKQRATTIWIVLLPTSMAAHTGADCFSIRDSFSELARTKKEESDPPSQTQCSSRSTCVQDVDFIIACLSNTHLLTSYVLEIFCETRLKKVCNPLD